MSGDNPDNRGDGSVSSSSIVTISSSDPAISYTNDPNGLDENKLDINTEKWCNTILQVSVPFFIAGIGTIGAGYILNMVKVKTLSAIQG